eukprot:TRINITY_DN776219_c0_g1_i1.p1 TRINITY_DN776219_c0_g1~~TRINITY_DN776219_c0_g1_i1.p1  ORF type:complete len:160 (+),score=40.46 TRINITY_DN776219_c0_g1_i1:59-538(+)
MSVNKNPTIYKITKSERIDTLNDLNSNGKEDWDSLEVFELIRHIRDPEHPLSLEQLKVVQPNLVHVNNAKNEIDILIYPTIPHCTLAKLIGLCIRVKLIRSVPERFKISVKIAPGSHEDEEGVNKQLNDKERVAASMENPKLIQLVNQSIANTDVQDIL